MIYKKNKYITTSDEYIYNQNKKYFEKFNKKKLMTSLLNNNLTVIKTDKKNKILFYTFENRTNFEYIKIHNNNINDYCKKYGYDYIFETKCKHNIYWCKIYLLLEQLKSNKYDYVVWLDSDTYIKNMNIDINNILNNYTSDIFVGTDNTEKYDLINAGVFIIKNTVIGKKYLQDCINYIPSFCYNKNNTLKGTWAGFCYEQGVMNLLIYDYYNVYTTMLPNEIIFNYNECSDDVFIMHMYASSDVNRVACFNSKIKET
jgi:hypothetical protein